MRRLNLAVVVMPFGLCGSTLACGGAAPSSEPMEMEQETPFATLSTPTPTAARRPDPKRHESGRGVYLRRRHGDGLGAECVT